MEKDLLRPELFEDKNPKTKKYLGKLALSALNDLVIAPPTQGRYFSFNRDRFSTKAELDGNWVRQYKFRQMLLRRDLSRIALDACGQVVGQLLVCPYMGNKVYLNGIDAVRTKVERDHIVSLRDAWGSGGWALSQDAREEFNVDPLENIMVSKTANKDKGALTIDKWRPHRNTYMFAVRQVAIKRKYWLTVQPDEANTMFNILNHGDPCA